MIGPLRTPGAREGWREAQTSPGSLEAELACEAGIPLLDPELAPIADQAPTTIEEALDAMDRALEHFHRHNDYRAIFLRAYRIITANVLLVIQGQRRGEPGVFSDPEWMSRLAGKFATLYFRSLRIFETPDRGAAWKRAYILAAQKQTTVGEDLLLGINAHIKYDLAPAICWNLRETSGGDRPKVLAEKKGDHDRANRILHKSIDDIIRILPRDYGGMFRTLDALMLRLDRRLAISVVRHHREKVWWDALDLLRSSSANQTEAIMARLDADSDALAQKILKLHRLPLLHKLGKRTRLQDFSSLLDPTPFDPTAP